MGEKTIGMAVIGCGHWGPNLVRNFQNGEVSAVRWVVDAEPGRLKRIGERFPGVRLSQDPVAALDDPEVQAVVIATPTSTHYKLVKEALSRGKDVLVEKPMAADAEQARELCALAERGRRILMVGHVFLFNEGIRQVKKRIDNGTVGRVHYISMIRTNLGPIRTDVNAAWDLAAHDVSIVNYWLAAQPVSVSASGGSWINPGIEDAAFITLRYPGAVLVNMHVSWLNPRKVREITVVGERNMLTFDDMNLNEPIRIYDKRVGADRVRVEYSDSFASFRASIQEGDITIPKIALGEPLLAECAHFIECVRRRTPPLSGGAEGLAVVKALAAAQRSMRNAGREETV